jgi:hypothetical protein
LARIKEMKKLEGMFWLMLRLLRSLQSLEGLLYATTVGYVVTSYLSAPFSKLRDQRLRKSCQDKLHLALDLELGIRLDGIKPHNIRLFSISGINNDLFLPIRMANPRKTNQGTTWNKS